MKVEIFTPPSFSKHNLDIQHLNRLIGKNVYYASKGRYALLHILKYYNHAKIILLPAYACHSIVEIVDKCGLRYYFYDLDEDDLNASLESIIMLHQKTSADILLVASMYGNPANLTEIENYCNAHGLMLIDDAAQSFGAKLGNRYIGTFGNAGFFSFSPGKSIAGHMGAFYWINDGSSPSRRMSYIKSSMHRLCHFLIYLDFYFNRLHIYRFKKLRIFLLFKWLTSFIYKTTDLSNDICYRFEQVLLGGILNDLFTGKFGFREILFKQFVSKFDNNLYFDIIKSLSGTSHIHKIVIKAKTEMLAQELMKHLKKNNVYCNNGYKMLTDDLSDLPHAADISNKIIEMPIENNHDRMEYLFNIIDTFRIVYENN